MMVAGMTDLLETAVLGPFVPVGDFGGTCSAAPLYKVIVRTNGRGMRISSTG